MAQVLREGKKDDNMERSATGLMSSVAMRGHDINPISIESEEWKNGNSNDRPSTEFLMKCQSLMILQIISPIPSIIDV